MDDPLVLVQVKLPRSVVKLLDHACVEYAMPRSMIVLMLITAEALGRREEQIGRLHRQGRCREAQELVRTALAAAMPTDARQEGE